MHNGSKISRTLRPICNSVVHAALGRPESLNTDMPLSSCQEIGNSDQNVTCGTPEVLDDVVFSPLVSYSNFVDRVDVFDQLQVCAPENLLLPLASAIESGDRSA